MTTIKPSVLSKLIEDCLTEFYQKRFKHIQDLDLKKILRRKNPYLFRAIGTEQASEIVKSILEAYMSSSDETIFGNVYFETIAQSLPGVMTSDGEGADFKMEDATAIRDYSLKSGPNPFNASQREKQNTQFLAMKARLAKIRKQFDPVLAYSYGRRIKPADKKHIYRETAGKAFWEEITGDPDFYLKLIRLMGNIPQRRKAEYRQAWDAAVNRLEAEFLKDFCFKDGRIDWEKLTTFVSG